MILGNLDVWETEMQRSMGGSSLELLNPISTQIWKTTSGLCIATLLPSVKQVIVKYSVEFCPSSTAKGRLLKITVSCFLLLLVTLFNQ